MMCSSTSSRLTHWRLTLRAASDDCSTGSQTSWWCAPLGHDSPNSHSLSLQRKRTGQDFVTSHCIYVIYNITQTWRRRTRLSTEICFTLLLRSLLILLDCKKWWKLVYKTVRRTMRKARYVLMASRRCWNSERMALVLAIMLPMLPTTVAMISTPLSKLTMTNANSELVSGPGTSPIVISTIVDQ